MTILGKHLYCDICGADITRPPKFYDGIIGRKTVYCYDCWEKHKEKERLRREEEKIEEEYWSKRRKL